MTDRESGIKVALRRAHHLRPPVVGERDVVDSFGAGASRNICMSTRSMDLF
ncbi:MAG: hypothetical protein ABIV11_01610 [Gemmatimonadaceae bacterium]